VSIVERQRDPRVLALTERRDGNAGDVGGEAGAPRLAAARLLRDPKIRIESPPDDRAYLVLDESPLSQPSTTRAYWAVRAALDLRASRP
jgi:hypothetical protein